MSSYRHTYNTTTSGFGPAGLADYNGEGPDASVSKKVYVEHADLSNGNSINVSRDGDGSTFKVYIKADYTDWYKGPTEDTIPLVSNVVLNALADARINSPVVVPTFIYRAIITSYELTTITEHHWECELTYETLKPEDPDADPNEDNPDNDFTQDPTTTYQGASRVEQVAAQAGHSVKQSVGVFDQNALKNPTFKRIQDGVESNVTQSVPVGVADFSVRKTYPVGTITSQFKQTVQDMTGTFNKSTFDGHGPGQVMFAGCDYSFDHTNKEIVTYKFQQKNDVDIEYVRYNHKFFAKEDWTTETKKHGIETLRDNPGAVNFGGVPLLANNNENIVARGWDIIQFAFQKIPYEHTNKNKSRLGSISVTIGHQVIRAGAIEDFDVLGLGL